MITEITFKYYPEKCSECVYCNWLKDKITHKIGNNVLAIIPDKLYLDRYEFGTIAFCTKFAMPINKEVMETTELDRHPKYLKYKKEKSSYQGGKCMMCHVTTKKEQVTSK